MGIGGLSQCEKLSKCKVANEHRRVLWVGVYFLNKFSKQYKFIIMSMLSDIRYDLSTDTLKSKLTIRERAQILCDITSSLQWESYEKYDSNGSWVETDIEKAVEDLQFIDNEKKS